MLNLIYGYESKNENHKKRNAEAIDLYDEKHKVAIQVTSENTHKKVQETIQKKRIAASVVITAAVLLPVLIFGLLNRKKPAAKVEFSEVLPFEKAGYYETYESLPSIENTKTETERAFSILSFVRNNGKQKSVIEKIQWEIINLKTTEKPVILLDGYDRLFMEKCDTSIWKSTAFGLRKMNRGGLNLLYISRLKNWKRENS